jgi:hypothetical protein
MFVKAHKRCKDGKQHVYYTLTESLRVNRKRVVQRTVLHPGELNTPVFIPGYKKLISGVHCSAIHAAHFIFVFTRETFGRLSRPCPHGVYSHER